MCGIYAFSGDSKPNLAKLKILGLANMSRGRDSCGVFYNGMLTKGVGTLKCFDDFIKEVIIEDVDNPDENVFIGHNRWSTVGANTVENAHPFLIDKEQIFAHNGTIKNIDDLLLKYNVDKIAHDLQVDSKGLGLLLKMNGKSILEEYRGYAAFINHYRKEKNTIWIFKGASRKWNYDTSPVEEERPLFYAVHKEGIYLSSLEDSLKQIRDGEGQDPIEVEPNKLIKIIGSEYAVETIDVYRETCNIGIDSKVTVTYPKTTPIHNTNVGQHMSIGTNSRAYQAVNQLPLRFERTIEPKKIDVNQETYPPRCFDPRFVNGSQQFVYYWKSRYYTDNNVLCHGPLFLNPDGFINEKSLLGYYEHYFWKGVMLDGKKCYDLLVEAIQQGNDLGMKVSSREYNFAKAIAPYSKYPVTNLITDSVLVASDEVPTLNLWFMRDTRIKNQLVQKVASHSFTPKFSTDRSYVFKDGILLNIVPKNSKDVVTLGSSFTENRYVNSSLFDIPLVGAETELNDNKLGYPTETKVVPLYIHNLKKYFTKVFLSYEEYLDECPNTVKLALNYFVTDILTYGSTHAPTKDDVYSMLENFVRTCIRDGVCFEESWIEYEGILSSSEYLAAAYRYEAGYKKKDTTSFNPIELDALDKEMSIKKCLEQVNRVTRFLQNKVVTLKGINNPLSKKLSEDLDSYIATSKTALEKTINNVPSSEFLVTKNDLLTVLNK